MLVSFAFSLLLFFFFFLNPVCVGKTESVNSLVKTNNYFVLQRCIVILWLNLLFPSLRDRGFEVELEQRE